MNAQKKNFFNKIALLAVVALLGGNMASPISAFANETEAEAAANEIIYYDDEELDALAGIAAEDYTKEQYQMIREVFETLKASMCLVGCAVFNCAIFNCR